MERSNSRKENCEQHTALRKQRSGLKNPNNNSEAETELRQRTPSDVVNSQLEETAKKGTVSPSDILRSDVSHDYDSQTDVASEISCLADCSHESLSFIGGKALYNLAQEMNALVDEIELGDVPNDKEGPMISGSVTDDDLDNLQRELANADQEFGDMFDWDGKSIIVVEAESDEGGGGEIMTDIPHDRAQLTRVESSDFLPQSIRDTNHHASLISLDESAAGLQEQGANTNARRPQHFKLTRMESNDFQPPAHSEQEDGVINLAPVSLKESTEGLKEEEYSRTKQLPNSAFRQLEEILALVQGENRAVKTEMDQIQQSGIKDEADNDKSMKEVEDKVLALMKRLRNKQAQYNAAMKQARDERAFQEQHLQDKEAQIQQLSTRYQQKTKEEESRRQKLEKALATVQKDLERVDSVTSDMVQDLDDTFSMGNSSSLHNTRSWRDTDSWSSPRKASLVRKDSPLSGRVDKIPEALTINHVLHMCHSPPKVSRMSPKLFDTPPDVVDEIKKRDEIAVQVLTELKAKEKKGLEEQSKSSIALDYGQAEPAVVNANVQDLKGNHVMLVSQFDQESDLLNKQLSVQREVIARLETKHKTMMENSRQRYTSYESELFELKAIYDEQLTTFADENDSLNKKLAKVTRTIDQLKFRHEQEISSLKLERHEIEKELLENSVTISNPDFDRFKQENESLSRQLVQYNEALDMLRSQHEQEMKSHGSSQTFFVEESKKLRSKYESTVGSFHRQKEILMKKLIEKERAISEIEVAQESRLKASKEEKHQLEEQLQALDERCFKMKRERAELLQTQKQKFEQLSLQLKELKAMRDQERNDAQERINTLEEKLETSRVAQGEEHPMLPNKLVGVEPAFSRFKSDYEVAVEASDTSRTSCLDAMADDDIKVRETRNVATAAEKLARQQSYLGTGGAIALLVVILMIWASVRLIQIGIEERNSLNRKIECLQAEVQECKMHNTVRVAMNAELQHSLDEAILTSIGHKKEALTLADQLGKLLLNYEALEQEQADYLDSYSQETSHDPLPRCFNSSILSLTALLEAQLEEVSEQRGSAKRQVEPLGAATTLFIVGMSEPVERRETQEEPASSVVEAEDPVVLLQENVSVKLVNSQATIFELSKAGLEAELFLVENLAMLSQSEAFENDGLHDLLRLIKQGTSHVTDVLDENVATFRSSLPDLQDDMKAKAALYTERAARTARDAASKLKNRLLPRHRRLIKSEEGVWLDL